MSEPEWEPWRTWVPGLRTASKDIYTSSFEFTSVPELFYIRSVNTVNKNMSVCIVFFKSALGFYRNWSTSSWGAFIFWALQLFLMCSLEEQNKKKISPCPVKIGCMPLKLLMVSQKWLWLFLSRSGESQQPFLWVM